MKINSRKTIFWLLIFSILWIPLLMFMAWYFEPYKHIDILIIDKTVNNKKREEHSAFSWVLNYEKYSKKDDVLYDKDTDYYGFFPKRNEKFEIKDFESFSEKELTEIVEKNDVLFYNDAYGVYSNEWEKKRLKNERSKKIYGGATMNEVMLLKKAKERNKLIITEFNILASPTSRKVRSEIEKEFGFKWSGWVGRYYDVLDTIKNVDIPRWAKDNYLMDHPSWPFKDSGIMLVREDGHIEILENKTHLTNENVMIYSGQKVQDEYNLPSEIKFNFWFDIISTSASNQVLSTMEIATNKKGDSIMSHYQIPNTFPSVIVNKNNKFYYFAGDFSDNTTRKSVNYLKGITFFSPLFIRYRDNTDREYFFWDFYKPLITKIFEKEYLKLNKK